MLDELALQINFHTLWVVAKMLNSERSFHLVEAPGGADLRYNWKWSWRQEPRDQETDKFERLVASLNKIKLQQGKVDS